MQEILYSLNATFPVFFMIIIGYFLAKIRLVKEGFVQGADAFNFNITLPALLFQDMASMNLREVFDARYVLFCAAATTVCFFAIWGGAKLFLKNKTMIGAFVHASYRSSAAVLGIAFIQNIYGNSGMAPLMILATVPLYNIYAVLILTLAGTQEKNFSKNKWKTVLIHVAKNPIILAIFAGTLVSLLRIDFPVMVDKTISNLAVMASPLALISIGAGFNAKTAITNLKPTLAAAFLKLILQAALMIPLAIFLGFRDEKLVALLIMLAAPTTPSCYIMARNMKQDASLTSSIIVVSTLLGAFTLTGWIYLLRHFQFI